MPLTVESFRFFDPEDARDVIERRLPHWSQPGTLCFITWRTWDSLPSHVVQAWLSERDAWLCEHGIQSRNIGWKSLLKRLPVDQQAEFHNKFHTRWEDALDKCQGACVLRRPELAEIVGNSLRHFDGDRYLVTDFVVMPNHVHLLAAFPDEGSMLKQCDSWKHFTAVRINKALGRRGRFWQVDGFDHLVRSADQFEYFRRYIANNPRRARLMDGEFVHNSREFV